MRRLLKATTLLVLAAVGLGASKAGAEEVVEQVMPFVQAGAYDPAANTLPVSVLDDFSDSFLDGVVAAEAIQGGAHARGGVGLVDFVKADATGDAAAGVELLMEFTVEDPQDRPQIKTLLNFASSAESVGSFRLG